MFFILAVIFCSSYNSNYFKNHLIDCDSLPNNKSKIENDPISIFFTKIDLNYDSKEDVIVSYIQKDNYGGPEFNIDSIYILKNKNCYRKDTTLPFWKDTYPSFFLLENKITTFCIFKDHGYGAEYLWINSKWILNKQFEVKNNGQKSVWKVKFLDSKKYKTIIAPYNFYPPHNVLKVEKKYTLEKPIFWE